MSFAKVLNHYEGVDEERKGYIMQEFRAKKEVIVSARETLNSCTGIYLLHILVFVYLCMFFGLLFGAIGFPFGGMIWFTTTLKISFIAGVVLGHITGFFAVALD